jgi:hypothetical protein
MGLNWMHFDFYCYFYNSKLLLYMLSTCLVEPLIIDHGVSIATLEASIERKKFWI